MFLVLVDSHSKWLDAHIMSNITAMATTEKLRSVFAIHGLPDAVVSDNGPTFTSEVFQEFMEKNGIRHVRTAPYHPASNGLAERAVETLKEGLRKMSGHSLETKLSRFLFQYRITPHTTTGMSPAELLLGRRPKSHLDLLHPDVQAKVVQGQEKQKAQRDRRSRDRHFKPGDGVFFRNFAHGLTWLPGVIEHQSGPVSFTVKGEGGRLIRRHQDHLRSRPETVEEDLQSEVLGDSEDRDEVEVQDTPHQEDGLCVQLEGLSNQTGELPAQAAQLSGTPIEGAGVALGASEPSGGTTNPRRSKRRRRPPERLTC